MSAPSKMVERAREAAKKKNFDYAIELYLEHLKVAPGDLDARKELRAVERERFKLNPPGMLGRAKIATRVAAARSMPVSKKDPEKTMLSCEDLLKEDPTAVPVLVKLGEAASYANQNALAIAVFEDALTLDAKNADGLRLLGRVYAATEDLQKALGCFQRLNKLLPQDAEAEKMCKDIPARMTLSHKVTADGKVKGHTDLIDKDKAQKLEKEGARVRTPEQAKERVESELAEIEKNGGKADAKKWRLLAEWSVMYKNYEQALEFFDKALAEKPDDYQSSEGKGDVKIRRYEDTIKKLKDGLKKSPEDDNLKAKLEKVTKDKNTFMIEEYTRRVAAHPTELGLAYDLGKALYDADRIDEAITQLQKSKQDARRKSESGYYLGLCYGMKKKIYALAIKELDAARQDIVDRGDQLWKDITYLMGRLHEAAKKPDKALAEFSAIAEVDYNYKDVTQRMEKLGSS